jgi:hypothetical protein
MKRLEAKEIEIIENLPRPTLPTHTFWIHPRHTKGVLIEITEKPSK